MFKDKIFILALYLKHLRTYFNYQNAFYAITEQILLMVKVWF